MAKMGMILCLRSMSLSWPADGMSCSMLPSAMACSRSAYPSPVAVAVLQTLKASQPRQQAPMGTLVLGLVIVAAHLVACEQHAVAANIVQAQIIVRRIRRPRCHVLTLQMRDVVCGYQ